jgi:hypothetical protein
VGVTQSAPESTDGCATSRNNDNFFHMCSL